MQQEIIEESQVEFMREVIEVHVPHTCVFILCQAQDGSFFIDQVMKKAEYDFCTVFDEDFQADAFEGTKMLRFGMTLEEGKAMLFELLSQVQP